MAAMRRMRNIFIVFLAALFVEMLVCLRLQMSNIQETLTGAVKTVPEHIS